MPRSGDNTAPTFPPPPDNLHEEAALAAAATALLGIPPVELSKLFSVVLAREAS